MVEAHAEGPRVRACVRAARPTLSVSGMAGVHVEGLLTLSDGGGQRKVRVHHPFLVVAVDDRLGGHGQRVTLGHVLGQGGEGLLGLGDGDRQKLRDTRPRFQASWAVALKSVCANLRRHIKTSPTGKAAGRFLGGASRV